MDLSHLISIVGAGPGDPELLTVKAQKRIIEADVILHDALFGDEILNLASGKTQKIYVGKWCSDKQDQTQRQNQINSLFLKFAASGKRVVRLKTGDPMIYGRGAEEIAFCKKQGLNYEVVPGITAGVAASSLAEIPLTERGKNAITMFFTPRLKNEKFVDLHVLTEALIGDASVMIYMPLLHLNALVSALLKSKVDKNMPVHLVSKISQNGQEIINAELDNVIEIVKQKRPKTPCTIIIGKYTSVI